jgi:hypothetical protein
MSTQKQREEIDEKIKIIFKKPIDELAEETTTIDSIAFDDKTFYIVEFVDDPFNSSLIQGRRYIVTFFRRQLVDSIDYLSIKAHYKQEPPFDKTEIQPIKGITARMEKGNFLYIRKLKTEPEDLLKEELRMKGGKMYRKKSMRKTYKKSQKKNKSRKYRK